MALPFNTIWMAFVASAGVLAVLLCCSGVFVAAAAAELLFVATAVAVVVVLGGIAAVAFTVATVAVVLATVAVAFATVAALIAMVVALGETGFVVVEIAAGLPPHATSMVSASEHTDEAAKSFLLITISYPLLSRMQVIVASVMLRSVIPKAQRCAKA
jgi:hypothetical protein